tara:strand:+ start:321 stop:599 length:279 start_codon:yes stop_codon:yes gene_type:complete
MFKTRKLRKLGLDNDTIERWIEMKDQIPNLQTIEGRKNKVKNRTPFQEWLETKTDSERKSYLEQNFIPDNGSFGLRYFDIFFKIRKKYLNPG